MPARLRRLGAVKLEEIASDRQSSSWLQAARFVVASSGESVTPSSRKQRKRAELFGLLLRAKRTTSRYSLCSVFRCLSGAWRKLGRSENNQSNSPFQPFPLFKSRSLLRDELIPGAELSG